MPSSCPPAAPTRVSCPHQPQPKNRPGRERSLLAPALERLKRGLVLRSGWSDGDLTRLERLYRRRLNLWWHVRGVVPPHLDLVETAHLLGVFRPVTAPLLDVVAADPEPATLAEALGTTLALATGHDDGPAWMGLHDAARAVLRAEQGRGVGDAEVPPLIVLGPGMRPLETHAGASRLHALNGGWRPVLVPWDGPRCIDENDLCGRQVDVAVGAQADHRGPEVEVKGGHRRRRGGQMPAQHRSPVGLDPPPVGLGSLFWREEARVDASARADGVAGYCPGAAHCVPPLCRLGHRCVTAPGASTQRSSEHARQGDHTCDRTLPGCPSSLCLHSGRRRAPSTPQWRHGACRRGCEPVCAARRFRRPPPAPDCRCPSP